VRRYFFASARSMTALRFSKGTAPSTFSPLTNIVGVPLAPIWAASAWSWEMRAFAFPEASYALKAWTLSPIFRASFS
jgi:hypothetical protein